MTTSVEGQDDGIGFGVKGSSRAGDGVIGTSKSGDGVMGTTRGVHKAGVRGVHTGHISAIAVIGELSYGTAAIKGQAGGGVAMPGDQVSGSGVWGDSSIGPGIAGTSSAGPGVVGDVTTGEGVLGISKTGRGVSGSSVTYQGVFGYSQKQAGVVGESNEFDGVFGVTHKATAAGVSGHNPGGLAGFFEGNVVVTGNLSCEEDIFLRNADIAEEFDLVPGLEAVPGSVMVLADDGKLATSTEPYDARVIGVVSGGGSYRPGMILGHEASTGERAAIAILGKVSCNCDARYGSIRVGDLLTTSPTPAHAMRSTDPMRALGTTIGKALRPLERGRGLIPILITLR